MKAKTSLAVAVLIIALCSSAHAQGAHGKIDPLALFEHADSNHDGIVSRDEYVAARLAKFAELDRNHDGFLTDDDFPRLVKAGERGERIRKMLSAADADHDGRVRPEEFGKAGGQWFDLADANHDGGVDQNELKQAAERFKALREK